jgi:hypothetical protein
MLIWSAEVYRTAIMADEGSVKLGMPVVALGDRRQGELDA